MNINYLDFLEIFPEIAYDERISSLNIIQYIKYIREINLSEKIPIKIDIKKLSDIVLKSSYNSILKKDLDIIFNNDVIFSIKHTDGMSIFERNNSKELNGKFNVIENSKNFQYFNDDEIKNIKRKILIDQFIDEKGN